MKKYLYGLYFVIMIITSLFYTSSPVYEMKLMIGLIPVVIMVGVTAVYFIINKKYKNLKNNNLIIIGAIVGTYILSCIITRGFSFRELYFYGGFIVGIAVIGDILISYDIKNVIKVFLESYVIISVLAGLFGVDCFVNKLQIWSAGNKYGYTGEGIRISSIMSNVNAYGLVCVIAVMISLILVFMSRNKIYKGIMICNALFQTILMIMTGSRTVILILGVFCLTYFIFFFESKYKKYIYLVAGGLTLLVAILTFSGYLPAGEYLLQQIFGGDFTTGRVEIWKAAFVGIKENVFFGVGIKNCLSTIGTVIGNPENTLGAHNGYISLLLANGILVFTSVCILISKYLLNAKQKLNNLKSNHKIALQLMICFCISMLFGNMTESILFGDFNFPTVMFWIMILMTSKYGEIKKVY